MVLICKMHHCLPPGLNTGTCCLSGLFVRTVDLIRDRDRLSVDVFLRLGNCVLSERHLIDRQCVIFRAFRVLEVTQRQFHFRVT